MMRLLLAGVLFVTIGVTALQARDIERIGIAEPVRTDLAGPEKTGNPEKGRTDLAGPEKIGIPELEKILNSPEDRLHVVNFWATWCPPCVTELPYFEKLSKEYQDKGVKFILISLDFPSQIDSKLIPFLKKNKITADVRVMTNLDYNSWIDRVDSSWQGNIPVTLFYNNARNTKYLHPSELNEKELRDLIIKYKQ